MAFKVKIPQNVRKGMHKLPHVKSHGNSVVLPHPSGVILTMTPVEGTDEANVVVSVDEFVVKQEFEKSIAETAAHPDFQ